MEPLTIFIWTAEYTSSIYPSSPLKNETFSPHAGFFFNGALSSGHFASYLDLAPNFSGTIFGISNTFSGGGTGFIVPLIIGALTQV